MGKIRPILYVASYCNIPSVTNVLQIRGKIEKIEKFFKKGARFLAHPLCLYLIILRRQTQLLRLPPRELLFSYREQQSYRSKQQKR